MNRFVPNNQCVPLLKRSKELGDRLGESADQIAATAKSMAPVDTGAYRDGIKADKGIERGEVIGRVNAEHWKSHFIEFGTIDTPTFAPLRKAAEFHGFRVRDDRRG